MITEQQAQDAVKVLLEYIGEDVNRDGLKDTPKRVVKSLLEMTSGYRDDLDSRITVFDSDYYDQMIGIKNVEIYSLCEHHILPFWGKCHIAYIPKISDKPKIIGLSKLARIADHFSNRLQVQERLTQQIGKYIEDKLDTMGVGVVIQASHMCMRCRGVQKQDSEMWTSYLGGNFRDEATKNEFLNFIKL